MAKRKTAADELHKTIIEAILDKKGKDPISLDLRKLKDAPAEFFIIAHGDSTTQVRAIFDNVVEETTKAGFKPFRAESSKGSEWMIADYGYILVHLFYREKRDFYALEELWSDAVETKYE